MMAGLQAGLIGLLVRHFGEIPFLRVGIAVMLTGFLLASMVGEAAFMVAVMFLTVSGATVCTPILNAITSHRTPPALRGRMMGTSSSASSWGRVCGPLFAGANLQLFGYSGAWLFSAAVAGVVGILLASEFKSGFSNRGILMEFDALVIALLGGVAIAGGFGSVVGMFFGALILAVVTTAATGLVLSPDWFILKAVAVFLAIVTQTWALARRNR